MDEFWKAAAAILVAVILCLTIGHQEKELAILLASTVVCITGMVTLQYIRPVLDLMHYLQNIANIHDGILEILLRIVGIAVASEMVGRICQDSGYGSMSKSIQLLGSAAIFYASMPLFESLIALLQDILANL